MGFRFSASFLLTSLLIWSVQSRTLEIPNRVRRDVASTLAVDSLGTPILTTGLDAIGASQVGTIGGGMGLGNSYGTALGLTMGMGTGLVDTSGLGTGGLGLTATNGEAVGTYALLSTFYQLSPVDTSTSFYVLPSNLQAFLPDAAFILENPPVSENYILACDLYGTGMCYYYYYY